MIDMQDVVHSKSEYSVGGYLGVHWHLSKVNVSDYFFPTYFEFYICPKSQFSNSRLMQIVSKIESFSWTISQVITALKASYEDF